MSDVWYGESMDAATVAAIVSAAAALIASLVTGLVVVFKGGRVVQSVQHLYDGVSELKASVEGIRHEQVEHGKVIAGLGSAVKDLGPAVKEVRAEQVAQGKAIAELKGNIFAPAPLVQGEANT